MALFAELCRLRGNDMHSEGVLKRLGRDTLHGGLKLLQLAMVALHQQPTEWSAQDTEHSQQPFPRRQRQACFVMEHSEVECEPGWRPTLHPYTTVQLLHASINKLDASFDNSCDFSSQLLAQKTGVLAHDSLSRACQVLSLPIPLAGDTARLAIHRLQKLADNLLCASLAENARDLLGYHLRQCLLQQQNALRHSPCFGNAAVERAFSQVHMQLAGNELATW